MAEPDTCRCWGFVDGVFRYTARPVGSQRHWYNGHYGGHGMKFQAISSPVGLIEHLHGPIPGRRHDAFMWTHSNAFNDMCTFSARPEQDFPHYYVYGDPAYSRSKHLMRANKGRLLTWDERQYNTIWSRVRVTVEWAFKDVSTNFPALDFARQQKIGLSPVPSMYRVAVLLTNCRTCLNGKNQTSIYFGLKPPTLQEYIAPRAQEAPLVYGWDD
jgi:nuclease HARBI1